MDIPKQVNWDPNYTFTISNPRPSLCLNMIVKNESKIITRLLQSVVGVIDTYCICDTGSTDNTIEVITEFFKNGDLAFQISFFVKIIDFIFNFGQICFFKV
jgi:glycosyltransferase involved in cell wall biosynthesis